MHLSEHGTREAPAIIFLHGNAVGGWMWQPYLCELPDYHCLLLDLPGHGKSNDLEWLFVKAWSQALDLRYSPELEKVKNPILLMAGEKEQRFIHQSNFYLVERLPNAKARIAPQMGHGWMGESPILFRRVLKAWLTDTALPEELMLAKKC